MRYDLLLFLCLLAGAWAQDTTEAPLEEEVANTTVVPILRHINKVNEDGSYTFGFEAADGTFKVETRDDEGNVNGKYGYIDDLGDLKIVEYTAGNGTGFSADSDLLPQQVTASPLIPEQLPSIPKLPPRPRFQPQRPAQQFAPRPQPQPQFAPRPQPQPQFAPRPQPQPQFAPRPQPQPQFAPRPQPQPQFVPQPQPQPQFAPQQQFAQQPQFHGQQQFAPQQFRPQPQFPQVTQRPVNVALEGFSDDKNQDGFVDGSAAEAGKGKPAAPPTGLPAGTFHLPEQKQPQFPARQPQPQPQFAPQQQQFLPQQAPQGFNRFAHAQPQVPQQQVTPQQLQFLRQRQQILAAQQGRLPQQGVPQQLLPQQQFAPQQHGGQQFAPHQFQG